MINYYYNKINLRSYLILIISIFGIVSLLLNYHFISVLLLIINAVIMENIYVRDIFVQYKNDLFLLKYKEYLWFKGIMILVLLVSFITIFVSNYYLFILIFHIILFSVFIYNFVTYLLIKKTIKSLDIENIIDNSIKIKSSVKESNYYILNGDIEYRINRSFCEYNKLRKLL